MSMYEADSGAFILWAKDPQTDDWSRNMETDSDTAAAFNEVCSEADQIVHGIEPSWEAVVEWIGRKHGSQWSEEVYGAVAPDLL